VALEVVDFEALVEIFRRVLIGYIFDDVLEEDLAEDFFEGLLLEFLESLSGDEFCELLLGKDWEDTREKEKE
jgi:hypothetical protein